MVRVLKWWRWCFGTGPPWDSGKAGVKRGEEAITISKCLQWVCGPTLCAAVETLCAVEGGAVALVRPRARGVEVMAVKVGVGVVEEMMRMARGSKVRRAASDRAGGCACCKVDGAWS